jgi:Transposase DDE domain
MTKVHFIELFSGICINISEDQLKRLLLISFGISQSKTVNISRVNDEILLEESGSKTLGSQYNYLLKAFQTGNYEGFIRSCFQFLVIHFYGGESGVKLLIDRTNWELGGQKINILVIGLLTKEGILIPLIWEDLGYKGNSDSDTRIRLIDQLLAWWRGMNIPVPQFEIIGDREFIGEKWLVALAQREIHYVIRLRCDLTFETWLEGEYKMDMRMGLPSLQDYMKEHKQPYVEVVLGGEAIAHVFIVENTNNYSKKEPFIYFITNMDDWQVAGDDYRKRWKIEVCFKHLKSLGFNLEDFNMQGQHKTNILMAILTLVYAITVKKDPCEQEQPNKVIEYKNGKKHPRKSVFRKGISRITQLKSFDLFLNYCFDIIAKFLHKWFLLNQLYINNLTVQ